ncbi:peptide chain release factor N(5)-glutamine methyltransferase [Paenibacillus sp. TRM 82003]|nr:peptide chain release factor N(5)-glutamine methyltransferase [Paenibacillus sp. TRM 82003]MCI3923491.1 peptide chain release factor N(5)-glutamine methyltransferase [Paenibacillus sp. TRM 82003]
MEEHSASAELLLMHVLGVTRTRLLTLWSDPMDEEAFTELWALLQRRAAGEPVQYIMGETYFYGLPFRVTKAVLIPRPETELLVERVAALARELWPAGGGEAGRDRGGTAVGRAGGECAGGERADSEDEGGECSGSEDEGRECAGSEDEGGECSGSEDEGRERAGRAPLIVDVGTGSGAIAVSLASQPLAWRVAASDISEEALEVARANASANGVGERVEFLRGDLLEPAIQAFGGEAIDAVVSNPPYIRSADMDGLQREVRDFEPHLALDGGADGLDPYRRMLAQMAEHRVRPRLVGFECGMGQAQELAALLRETGWWPEVSIVEDYARIERHVIGVRR